MIPEILIAALLAGSLLGLATTADANLRERPRLLLLAERDVALFREAAILEEIVGAADALRDRALVLYFYAGKETVFHGADPLSLDEEEDVPPRPDDGVTLIGKDGGIKGRWSLAEARLEEIFELIDAMPMRRTEMARPTSHWRTDENDVALPEILLAD